MSLSIFVFTPIPQLRLSCWKTIAKRFWFYMSDKSNTFFWWVISWASYLIPTKWGPFTDLSSDFYASIALFYWMQTFFCCFQYFNALLSFVFLLRMLNSKYFLPKTVVFLPKSSVYFVFVTPFLFRAFDHMGVTNKHMPLHVDS